MGEERKIVGVRELRGNLSALLREVGEGAAIVITSNGKPIAELRPPSAPMRASRRFGGLKGQIWMAEDFDETPQDIIDSIEADL